MAFLFLTSNTLFVSLPKKVMSHSTHIELLSPAKNAEIGIEAIKHGADAIYIGAPKFGARQAAGNTIEEIQKLADFAHIFGAKVLVTLNTILTDEELNEAEKLIQQLYEAGADALIVQDMGILSLHLPPIRLHASTQADNRTPERVKFLQDVGFSRVVLARELGIEEIRNIRQQTDVELEAFVHGALCVSYSGQCYLSQALCGRSANRGACAQLCRLPYDLIDAEGHVWQRQKHLLSLKDMDRSDYLKELLDAGVSSLKIEGRLKDMDYVKNIVSYYRKRLDLLLGSDKPYQQASFGRTIHFFEPNPQKTFHRGATDYFLHERTLMAQWDTPKSMGEPIGKIKSIRGKQLWLATNKTLQNGDGLCYVGKDGFTGFRINTLKEGAIQATSSLPEALPGTIIYRNFDQQFEQKLAQNTAERKLPVKWTLIPTDKGFSLSLTDLSRNICTNVTITATHTTALKPEQMANTIVSQLSKLGDTPFEAVEIVADEAKKFFIPAGILNTARRDAVEQLLHELQKDRREKKLHKELPAVFPQNQLDYTNNIYNKAAEAFYRRHGAQSIQPAFEKQAVKEAKLMSCKYCIRYEMGICPKQTARKDIRPHMPLYLVSGKNRLQLHFDCQRCEMYITKA